jgi:hypothetical protein
MMNEGIERLGETTLRIGPKTFRLVVAEHPLPDGTYMGVEGAGRPFSEHQQQFDLEVFKGVLARQLLKGLYIGVYSPIVESPNISYIEIANPYGNPTLLVSLTFDYADWTHEANVIVFCKGLAARLSRELPGCTSARSKPADVCVDVSLRIDIAQAADIYEFVRAIDERIKRIMNVAIDSPDSAAAALKPDEHGYMWWVRHALIPLAGSAAILAIIRYLLQRQA